MKKKYVLAIDASLSNTGGVVFSNDGKPKYIFSIDTSKIKERKKKLEYIGKTLKKIAKEYSVGTVVLEQGFSRFAGSTQALYMVFGVINFIFSNMNLFYYHPSTIRKTILGEGNADKKAVYNFIKTKYPKINFENFDQSDAFAVGMCFFIKEEGNENKKNF